MLLPMRVHIVAMERKGQEKKGQERIGKVK